MGTDIAQMAIRLGVDSSDVIPGMDRATAGAVAGAAKLSNGLSRFAKVPAEVFQNRVKDLLAAQKAGADPRAIGAAYKQAEADREQAVQNAHRDTQQRARQTLELEVPQPVVKTPGRLTEALQRANAASEQLGGRRAVRMAEAGFEGATNLIGAQVGQWVNDSRMGSLEVVQNVTSMAQGIGTVLGGPALGHAIGAVGSAVQAVATTIDDIFNATSRKATKFYDEIVSGGRTVAQGIQGAREQGLEEALRESVARQQQIGMHGSGGAALTDEQVRERTSRITRELQRQFNQPGMRQLMIEVSAERARGQIADLTADLARQAATAGLSPIEAAVQDRIQRLAQHADISAVAAERRLRGPEGTGLRGFEQAQQENAIGGATSSLRDQNNALRDQVATAGLADDAARRRIMILQLQRDYNISAAEAERRLGAAMQANAVLTAGADIAALARTARQERLSQTAGMASFQTAAQLQGAQRGLTGEAPTTTDESLGRQRAMAQREAQQQEALLRAREAEAPAAAQRQRLREQRRAAEGDVAEARQMAAQLRANGQDATAAEGLVAVREEALGRVEGRIAQALEEQQARNGIIAQAQQALGVEQQRLAVLDQQQRALELQRAAQQEAFQVTMSMRTPLEQYNAEMVRLNDLRARGNLSEEAHQRAVGAAQDRLEQAAGGPIDRRTESLSAGTVAAVSAINRIQNRDVQESPMMRLLRVQEQLRQMQADAARVQREQVQAQRELNARVGAGYVLAALNLGSR